ncbi:MAG: isopentenyl transferase family protein [Deferribacteraceae bacterium]|jgi:hypothetical protein|nr:isopentenyl transferase family protein [Deferribacteraceae bacterium]
MIIFEILLAILLFLVCLLVIGYIVLRIFFHHVKGAIGLFRNKPEPVIDEANIIEVTPVEHELTEDEKRQAGAIAVSKAIKAASGHRDEASSFAEESSSFANLVSQTTSKETKAELAETLRTLRSINTVIDKSSCNFDYTLNLLAKCLFGADIILTDEPKTSVDFVIGLRYAIKYCQTYLLELSMFANMTAAMDKELIADMQSLLGHMERFRWLHISYPDTALKNSELIESMLQSLSHKLQMCSSMKDLGIGNRESADLMQTIAVAVKDLNSAVANMLESAFSWDLLKADVDLETLRRELRLRGL